jgi:hypothetical protein
LKFQKRCQSIEHLSWLSSILLHPPWCSGGRRGEDVEEIGNEDRDEADGWPAVNVWWIRDLVVSDGRFRLRIRWKTINRNGLDWEGLKNQCGNGKFSKDRKSPKKSRQTRVFSFSLERLFYYDCFLITDHVQYTHNDFIDF